ncbi:DnaJ-domain-containing protein [Hesseltinella vesiculosa]|uniref:DnaJ-domain-containing protein n=1 Tax=Hesseltinella vesiculosa TaxID=101127 RepID=A0A1X2G3R8_9FUNG|nr:DnaJ-domain-containing protein [Hesseltinella vesiculosa]
MWRSYRWYSNSARRRSPFDILNVKRTATSTDIKQQYLILAKQLHPDAKPGGNAKAFQQVLEAYQFLKNPYQRQRYLDTGEGWETPFNGAPGPWGTPKTGGKTPTDHVPGDNVTYKDGPWSSHQNTRYTSNLTMFLILSGVMVTLAATNFMYTPFASRWIRALDAHHEKSAEDLRRARMDAKKYGNQHSLQRVKDASSQHTHPHDP